MRFEIKSLVACLLAAVTFGALAQERELTTNQELASYAAGVQIARSLRQQAEQFEMDAGAVAMAIEDILSGRDPRYPLEQLQTAMVEYQTELQGRLDKVAEDNLIAADEFMKANRLLADVQETESGLQYKVLESGEGASPAPGDQVLVHYRGTLLDGTEFDSSYSRGQPVAFRSNQVISAWQEALALMRPGDKWELYVHPDLGYGPNGSGGAIGPNEAMIFLVELIEVQ